MASLSPTALFSPSLARAQQASQNDWSYIDSWLASLFASSKPPPFERTPETLKYLLALAAQNEAADEEAELLFLSQQNALEALQKEQEAEPNAEILEQLEGSLSREGKTALDALAELSGAVSLPLPEAEKLGRRMLDLHITSSNLVQAADRVAILDTHLNKELGNLNVLIEDLQSDTYHPSTTADGKDFVKETIDMQRKSKVLLAKLPELRERVASLSTNLGGGGSRITISDVKIEEEKFKEMLTTVRELENQVKSYHGLPQDTDLARLELEQVRVELRDLTRRRDTMFEGLVERESPKKTRS
ncbi:hypothetical protein B0O99DRAFT_517871 [Bisporella sp. PMI_857]|nr:hypothetical protein B0O99DRAFT_517871 [Bisporella sp. PMI_857]